VAGWAFISYRREDSAALAQALYLQLRSRFGSGQLFMDVNSIPPGSRWPGRITSQLERATVVLALMGAEWLKASDEYGRRRLDDAGDWVRLELATALRQRTPVLPVVIGSDVPVPPPKALPDALARLPMHQAVRLHSDAGSWLAEMTSLSDHLLRFGLSDDVVPDVRPVPSKKKAGTRLLSHTALDQALAKLPGWEPWEESLTREYPLQRQDLRKNFVFPSFELAIEFMAFMAPRFQKLNHHPRWGNEWKIVTVRLTTWDAGNRLTKYDIAAARVVDEGCREFSESTGRPERCRGRTSTWTNPASGRLVPGSRRSRAAIRGV
jgi:pterin-4a-carbinolamine dehydratase